MVEIDIITVTYHGLTSHAIGTEFGFTAKVDGRKYKYLGFDTLEGAINKLKPPNTAQTLRASGKPEVAAKVEERGAIIGGVSFSPAEFKETENEQ